MARSRLCPDLQEAEQLADQGLAPLHLGLGALERELVAAQADVAVEKLLQGAQMAVVLAHQ